MKEGAPRMPSSGKSESVEEQMQPLTEAELAEARRELEEAVKKLAGA